MNTPKNEDGTLNYGFNPQMQLKEYLDLVHEDIANNLEKEGVRLDLSGEKVSKDQEGWELNFKARNTKKSFCVKYSTNGFEDTWLISTDATDQKVRFPKVACRLWSGSDSFSFHCHTYNLEGKVLLKLIAGFLKPKK